MIATGLEPAASGVTGRRSNQLNYHPKVCRPAKAGHYDRGPAKAGHYELPTTNYEPPTEWAVQGSNLRHPACKAGALPLS